MAKIGRPTTYTPELTERICDLVATTTMGVDELCATYPEFPDESTIRLWRFKYPEFSRSYAQAKMFQAELMAEEIHRISKYVSTYTDAEGNERVDSGSVASQRLQVDSIKWHASKLAPKIYGDRKTNEELSPQDTLSKIKSLVDDLNKTNSSEI